MKRLLAGVVLLLGSLIAAPAHGEQAAPEKRTVAILMFDGVEMIDFAGPYEVFSWGRTNGKFIFDIVSVAATKDPLKTPMKVVPDYTIENSPKPDILIVPGGDVGPSMKNPKVLQYIRDSAKTATVVMSVCNGAWLLAEAGVLDGREVTTTALGAFGGSLQRAYPNLRVVSNKRFVDSGNIVTTAGLSSGIDGSLHVVSKLLGEGHGQDVATAMEYDWRPELGYVRAQLADMHFIQTYRELRGGMRAEPSTAAGDRDHWESQLTVPPGTESTALNERIEKSLTETEHWRKSKSTQDGASVRTTWTFTDAAGATWDGWSSVQPSATRTGMLTVVLGCRRR